MKLQCKAHSLHGVQMPHCFNMKLQYKTIFLHGVQDGNVKQRILDKIWIYKLVIEVNK